ncbi:hypothetical protein HYH03_015071 [Edaphochlamys debaryana]|uniref:Uncharacterized protein n=1 Tax=Edaphochlamys debaryana TaxID=47281 RepID=A0A835XMW2_9CHLO|nr:hypothetical protein HYH03_015071 [Edaphochlamys debaryana]|eukprot:KAG2486247.1 hypothetical protein HYH03_015071 [Edaphochlamys debaryana]
MLKLLRDGHGLQNGILPSSQHPKSKVLLVAFTHNRTRYRRDPRRRERLRRQAAQHQFVLSPEGAGMDTFRFATQRMPLTSARVHTHKAWETLLLGSYPVVFNNSLTPLYDGLPVLVVRNVTELTPALLAAYDAFRGRRWDPAPLYMGHHFAAVGRHRLGQSKEYRLEYRLRRP